MALTMNILVINSLWIIIITGKKLELEDPHLAKILEMFDKFFRALSPSGSSPVDLILQRSMTKWPILDSFSRFKTTKSLMDSIVDLMTPYVEDHKRTLDLDNVQDFLDLMLI